MKVHFKGSRNFEMSKLKKVLKFAIIKIIHLFIQNYLLLLELFIQNSKIYLINLPILNFSLHYSAFQENIKSYVAVKCQN